tara:strand:- start:1033 stop:2076 length:1044 start_codon:yes stop_codon:yes gene_type:complete
MYKDKPLTYGSVCSGIESVSVAWKDLFKPKFFSEIEEFPREVLKHHYPHVPLHGDFTTIKGEEYGAIDILVGGTPCQSFSVSGLRKGLEDPRGNLCLGFVQLIKRIKPKYVVWENVGGVLTSNQGKDFQCFLTSLAEWGYGLSWRILDSQYFGVPQRRRRVFVVGCLGDDFRSATQILFESESLCGNIKKSKKERKNDSKQFGESFEIHGSTTANTLCARDYKGVATDNLPNHGNLICEKKVYENHGQDTRFKELNGVGQTITSSWGVGGNNQSLVTEENWRVRKLTPIECERLQGFEDNYTQIPYKGKSKEDCPMSPRYKALGNSMTTNVMKWIGTRIYKLEKGEL